MVAATKLPTVTDVPLHFKAVSVTLQPEQKSDVSTASGILYQMSGSTEVARGGQARMLNAGEALFIAGGETAVLTAGTGGPSTFLHFFLVPTVDLGRPVEDGTCRREGAISHWRIQFPTSSQAVMISISHELHFRRRCPPTRRTIGRELPCTYIISGTGANTVDSKTRQQGDQVP